MKKKIVLLGDSIRIAYGQYVPELLGDDYDVWQPADNCRFAQYTLRMLFDEKHNLDGAHVIHWNNGLWDVPELFDDGVFTPEDMYVNTMLRIAKILYLIDNGEWKPKVGSQELSRVASKFRQGV